MFKKGLILFILLLIGCQSVNKTEAIVITDQNDSILFYHQVHGLFVSTNQIDVKLKTGDIILFDEPENWLESYPVQTTVQNVEVKANDLNQIHLVIELIDSVLGRDQFNSEFSELAIEINDLKTEEKEIINYVIFNKHRINAFTSNFKELEDGFLIKISIEGEDDYQYHLEVYNTDDLIISENGIATRGDGQFEFEAIEK